MSSGSSELETYVRTLWYREYHTKHFPGFDSPAMYIEFDIILGFASENYILGGGTGNFKRTWDDDVLSPQKLFAIKQKYPQVKVIISIGGDAPHNRFDPAGENQWVTNAVSSIKQIIHHFDYNDSDHDIHHHNLIDGIDIHYNDIRTSEEEFSSCIGQVITQLKNDTKLSIKVVSIAPTKNVEYYYHKLYLDYKDTIDLVDYQFYNQHFSKVEEVVELYEKLVAEYTSPKVLPGISFPHPNPVLKEAIKHLIQTKSTIGYFVWNVDGSALGPNPLSIL